MITALAAANAYAATQGQAVTAGAASAAEAAGPDFGELLKSVMNDTMQASKHAEQQMAAHVQGKAELVDVVTSVASAEASLETVMAVRDQVIAAYQEIMRMPI